MGVTIIATWYMAHDGVLKAQKMLVNGGNSLDAVEVAINDVENNKTFTSVGYGGLPNKKCVVELDAGIMDGDSLSFGCVGAVKNYKNPISIARKLMNFPYNNFLVARGAEKFAKNNGFKKCKLLTKNSIKKFKEQKKLLNAKAQVYKGHDTVGVVCLDKFGKIVSGTSTSGLFFKECGRVGDSPLAGLGYYANSKIGGACATGLGEDIIKCVTSYEVVRLMAKV